MLENKKKSLEKEGRNQGNSYQIHKLRLIF